MLVRTSPHLSARRIFLDEVIKNIEMPKRDLRSSFRDFFKAYEPNPHYVYGRHTNYVIDELQEAVEKLEHGISSYLIFTFPFRHGKSDVISRRFPAWDLARNPDHEIILTAYNTDLATEFSYDVRSVFQEASDSMGGLRLQQDRKRIGSWKPANRRGAFFATGIRGTITGRGAKVLLVDDYFKNREEAESVTIQDKTWQAFTVDVMSRLAPVHLVVITANRWHVRDLVGRIKAKNTRGSREYDPEFPQFREIVFPAQSDDYITPENPEGWLFPERYSPAWYKAQRAALGTYSWKAQALGAPQHRQGNLFRVDHVEVRETLPEGLKFYRGWDLASTDKERTKPDPDYTCGTKAAFHDGVLYVDDVVCGQWATTKRNQMIDATIQLDGLGVEQNFEVVAGYKDVKETFADRYEGMIRVRPKHQNVDKVARAAVMEPLFESQKVVIRKAPWNEAWLTEFGAFPRSAHDDQVDSLEIAIGKVLRKRFTEIRTIDWRFGRSFT